MYKVTIYVLQGSVSNTIADLDQALDFIKVCVINGIRVEIEPV